MSIEIQLAAMQSRLRAIRKSKGLTLSQVSTQSKGALSAIALGSYERGDRSLSVAKLFELSELYALPATDLLSMPDKGIISGRVIIDLRKLTLSGDPWVAAALQIIHRIAHMRHDWNGEVISLRGNDVALLQIFANFSENDMKRFLEEYALTKLK